MTAVNHLHPRYTQVKDIQRSIDLEGEALHVLEQDTKWELSLEFIGLVSEPGAHGGGAGRHRTKEASSVFCSLKPFPCNPLILLSERVKAYRVSVLSSATWLSGCWTFLVLERAFVDPDVQLPSKPGGLGRPCLEGHASRWS